MLDGLAHFARSGFAPFAAEWATLDSLRDVPVTVVRHDGACAGVARGADVDGALLLDTGGEILRVHAGEVSLRPAGSQAEPAP
jgi:BirA family biotin operon repressor/biotin-[acetyl-CoA-carboxylase] ligase